MEVLMKRLYAIIFALVLAGCLIPPVQARAEEQSEAPAVEALEMPPVPQLLAEATYLTRKKPNLKARYYIFLRSMSWCVPCHMFCPVLFKDYGKMKSAKAELVFLGQEEEAVVKQYMKEREFKCPGVLGSELGDIPGFDLSGFGAPAICIVTADGEFVGKLGGKNMADWRKVIKEYQTQQARKKRASKK